MSGHNQILISVFAWGLCHWKYRWLWGLCFVTKNSSVFIARICISFPKAKHLQTFFAAENVSGNSSLAQILSTSADPHSITDCKVFFAGFVMGLDSPELAQQAYNMTEGMKARKVTCMPTRRCLAKIDDKCALFAPEKKKKNTSTEGPWSWTTISKIL